MPLRIHKPALWTGLSPRSNKRRLGRFVLFSGFLFLVALPAVSSAISQRADANLDTLKKIYNEVKELGPYPSQPFILHEFFAGAPDDDDTNKEQHVAVLIQTVNGVETMKIQVTELERSKEDRNIKYAKGVKNISCRLVANRLEVQSSDYSDREMAKLAPDILQAIRNKKKLLKLKVPQVDGLSEFVIN